MKPDQITQHVRRFIINSFLFGRVDQFKDEDSFLDRGILDSTGVLELVSFLEETFRMQISDEEISPENLDSVDRITAFVGAKLALSENNEVGEEAYSEAAGGGRP